MLDKNFNKLEDEYGKEAICLILQRRDGMSEEEAKELIAQFEEELSEMIEEDSNKDKGFTYSLYQIEETFSDYFGLEPDYLFCFLNDVLAKGSKTMEYTKCKIEECEIYILDGGKTQPEYCYMHYAPVLTIDDYQNAIDACSACNVSGLVGVMNEVKDRIWATDRKYGVGTYFVNHHPIIQLYAYQIAYLSHGRESIEWSGFSDAYKFCKSVVAGEILPDANWMESIFTCYHLRQFMGRSE